MKNTKSNKLNLNRETLAPLTSDELDGVNGGITPSLVYSAIAISGLVGSAAGSAGLMDRFRSKA